MARGVDAIPCRLCSARIEPRLFLPQAPLTVQNLLSADELADDTPVSLTICRCPECGLVQLAEDPDLSRVYSDKYLWSLTFSPHQRRYQEALASRWIAKHGLEGKRVLEVGGGDGFFASLMSAGGCDVTYIDPAARACQAARDRGLSRVIENYLTPETMSGERFDAIVIRHVLEHVTRPLEFLRLLKDHLVAGGKLLVEVPNLDDIVEKTRFQDFFAEHVSYFDAATLSAALTRAGLEIMELDTIEQDDYLIGVARAPSQRFGEMIGGVRSFTAQLQSMIDDSHSRARRMAVWGAGGRCVALLSLIQGDALTESISYIVDSDPKKWGLFAPVTHLPVVAPERLRDDPVDDILIFAIAFRDEILRDLGWFRDQGGRVGVVHPEPRWLVEPATVF